MNLEKVAVKGVLWSFLEKWGGQLISTTVFLLLARLLGPEAFGLTALASVVVAFMSSFVEQGFVPAIIQREDLEPAHLDTAFWTSIAIGLILMVGTILASGQIAVFLGEPKIRPIVQWFSIVFLFIALQSVQNAILRRNFAFKSLAFRSLVATFSSGGISVVLAFMGFGVWSLVAQQLINRGVNVLMLWGASPWRPGFNVSRKHFKDLFAFGVYEMGVNFLRFFNRRSDDFLIGYFLGPVALGYYTVAYRLLLLMVNIFTNVTTTVALPTFSRLQQDPVRMKKAFYKATQLTSFISFPAFSGVFILAPELVNVMFGDNWEASIPVMQVLVMAGILQSVSYFNATVMLAKGKPSWRLILNCFNAVLNVIGFMIAVDHGIVAVAIAFVISNYLLVPAHLWILKQLADVHFREYFRRYIGPLVASVLMVIQIYFLKRWLGSDISDIAVLSASTVTGALSYGVAVFLFDRKLFDQVLGMANNVVRAAR